MSAHSVTVIIPCHAQEHYLLRALSSVIWQLQPGDEIIVVHDSPKPIKPAALKPFKNQITILENRRRKGVAFSRNRAIRRAKTPWIKFLDADDILAPFALSILRGKIEIPDTTQIITGGMHRYCEDEYWDYLCANEKTLQSFNQRNPTLPSLVFARRSALLEVGLFDERIEHEEDWDLWFRIRQRYGIEAFQIVNQPVCYYWIHSADRTNKYRRATINGKLVRDIFRERYGADPPRLVE